MNPELKRFAVLADLSEEEQDEVAAQLEERQLDTGETLFSEGEEADGLVLVASGALGLATRRSQEKGTLGAGACVGGLSLFAIGARELTATAMVPTRVLLLARAGYRRLVIDSPRAACRLTESVLVEVAGLTRGMLDRIVAAPVDRSPRDP